MKDLCTPKKHDQIIRTFSIQNRSSNSWKDIVYFTIHSSHACIWYNLFQKISKMLAKHVRNIPRSSNIDMEFGREAYIDFLDFSIQSGISPVNKLPVKNLYVQNHEY